MIDFTHHQHRFRYRVAGVAIHEEHVLLHTMDDADFWILPGGRVELGELSSDALKREMQEELGQVIQVGRLLWVVESFLWDAGHQIHGIGLYYAMQLAAPETIRAPFETMDGKCRLSFAWQPLALVGALKVYPPFLQHHLLALPDHPQHIADIRTALTP
jgi:ADP-ribose pyrophosphatase YjhB (NUDIX family)